MNLVEKSLFFSGTFSVQSPATYLSPEHTAISIQSRGILIIKPTRCTNFSNLLLE